MGAVYFIVSKKTGQVAPVTLGEKLAQRCLEDDPDLSGIVVMGGRNARTRSAELVPAMTTYKAD